MPKVSLKLHHLVKIARAISLSSSKTHRVVRARTSMSAPSLQHRGWQLAIALGMSGAIAFSGERAFAQIRGDNTLGAERSRVTSLGAGVFQIQGGATRGKNLFHSLSEFSVPTNGVAYFNNTSTIQNIITRVTGVSFSSIDGTLQTNGGANLFLLNPNGIIFGPNARLNIGGSFVATTANAIQFGNQGIFSASDNLPPARLTVNPSAFLFNQLAAQPIRNQSIVTDQSVPVGLRAGDGKTLLLLGGDVILEGGGFLSTLGGRVELGGVAGAGTVGLNSNFNGSNLSLNFPSDLARANVFLTNGSAVNVGTRNKDAKGIFIQAGSIFLADDAQLSSSTFGSANAGIVSLQASNTVSITNGSAIFSTGENRATGNAGLILIDADSIYLDAAKLTTTNKGTGLAGSIGINAHDLVSIQNNSQVTSESNNTNTSDFGFIKIAATAGSILLNQSTVSTTNAGLGFAGDISVTARDQVSLNQSSISSQGNLGRIFIGESDYASFSPRIVTLDSSMLNTTSSGSSNTGGTVINAHELVVIGNNSKIVSNSKNNATDSSNFGFIQLAAPEGSVVLNQSEIDTTNTGAGFSGDILISARDQISILNQSQISSQGNQGRILIGKSDAYDNSFSPGIVTVDSSTLTTDNSGAAGRAGDISIAATDNVLLTNNSLVLSDTSGDTDAGNIAVQSDGSVFLTNGAVLSTSTFGVGKAGIVTVEANGAVSIDNSGLASGVGLTGIGDAGGIGIEASSLLLTNGATLTTETNGRGNAGLILLAIDGNISVSSGAVLKTQTSGIGNSGIVLIEAGGDVSLTGSGTGIFSTVEDYARGSALGIGIKARSLSMSGGAELQALTRGEGNAGVILINTSNFVNLSGFSPEGFSTALLTSTEDTASGVGGVIEIKTPTLRLSDGAVLSARTRNAYVGGDINVNVNTLEATNGGQILTTAFSTGRAGIITVNATDSITLSGRDSTFTDRFNQTVAKYGPVLGPQVFDNVAPGSSGLFANTVADSNAQGGSINITTRDLSIRDGAQVALNNQGLGIAGDLQIQASRNVQLENQSLITTETRSGNGGDITMNVGGFLLLLSSSDISTTAGTADAGGNGGNIKIDTTLDIISSPSRDSNIKANAFTGTGGNIEVSYATLRGIAPRPLNPTTNDINASSRLGIDGKVTTNSLNVDPIQGFTKVLTAPIDASQQIAQNCSARGRNSTREENKFTITGRGGLPPSPNDTLHGDSVITNWVTLDPEAENRAGAATSANPNSATTTALRTQPTGTTAPTHPVLMEAQGWVYGPNGEVILTASAPTVTPQPPALKPAICPGS